MAAVNLTTTDFDAKIKTGIALVDFWAEWCVAPESQIMVSKRGSIEAEKIVGGENLLNMGKDGLFIDIVDMAKVVADGGHCKQITTETGRVISITDDHLFFTDGGWKRAGELVAGEKVAVFPALETVSSQVKKDVVIVDSQLIKLVKGMSTLNLKKYHRELVDKGLLPLRLTSEKLPVLARIAGAVFSDGNLYLGKENNYREISFCLGSERDVEELVADLRLLGVGRVHINKRQTHNQIQGRKFVSNTFRVKVLSTALWLLLSAMGVPRGRKTDVKYGLPKWLGQASKLVQREFLAAYLGGDGPRVDIRLVERKRKQPYNNISINDLEFHKRLDLEENGLSFAKSIAGLLISFGVRIAKVFSEGEDVVWQKGRRSAIIHIQFKHDVETAFALTRKIGYVYCLQKQNLAETVGEFMARIRQRRAKWRQKFLVAKRLATTGVKIKEIAQELVIGTGTVWGWLKQGKTATTGYYKEKFKNWILEAKVGLGEGFLWDVVGEVEEVFLPKVARITVATNHNFVANGFVVHNCGPCKMSGPIIDQMANEYAGRVLVAKVEVDAQPDLAGKFGVMSIPTVILFKDGVEVGRQVGFAGKQGYLDLLKKANL